MQNFALTAELVHQRHADLHRQAGESRLAAAGRGEPDAVAPAPGRPVPRRTRRRLGLLLMALGARLAPVEGPTSR